MKGGTEIRRREGEGNREGTGEGGPGVGVSAGGGAGGISEMAEEEKSGKSGRGNLEVRGGGAVEGGARDGQKSGEEEDDRRKVERVQ